MPSQELIPQPEQPEGALVPAIQLQRLFELAVQQGPQGVEALERLVALQAQVEARQAQRDFAAAMAAFKAECPPIPRRTENAQFKVTKNGGSSVRLYASLEDIEATVRGPLGRNGLAYRWGTVVLSPNAITMPCIVTHRGGHSIEAAVPMPLENKGGASEQQKYGIAMTYSQRYSLIHALGLTSCDEDTDGNEPVERVTPDQVLVLEALIDQRPEGSRARLLTYLDVAALEDIPADRFEWLKGDLEMKIRGGK